jgi:N,N'-diacetyllegionaminate synthase
MSNITSKRPGNGISPMRLDEVLGRVSNKNYLEDDQIAL